MNGRLAGVASGPAILVGAKERVFDMYANVKHYSSWIQNYINNYDQRNVSTK